MFRRTVRFALMIGAMAAAVPSARADHACTSPCTRTISRMECVPETYKTKRTTYKVECRTEEVDGFRTECVPVQKQKEVVCTKRVPVMKTEKRTVCKKVTCYEDRTVMKKSWQTVQETVMKKKLVRLGHWECVEVDPLFGGLFHRNKCCDPCDPCAKCCAPKKVKKKWVFCPEYQCCPTTVCKKVCVETPTVCKVPVCKTVQETVDVQVCTYECVQEKKTVTYTEYETRKVPCKVQRTVRVCVPHEEEVTCTRMVRRCVTREVACTPCCETRAPRCGFRSSCCR